MIILLLFIFILNKNAFGMGDGKLNIEHFNFNNTSAIRDYVFLAAKLTYTLVNNSHTQTFLTGAQIR